MFQYLTNEKETWEIKQWCKTCFNSICFEGISLSNQHTLTLPVINLRRISCTIFLDKHKFKSKQYSFLLNKLCISTKTQGWCQKRNARPWSWMSFYFCDSNEKPRSHQVPTAFDHCITSEFSITFPVIHDEWIRNRSVCCGGIIIDIFTNVH